MDPFKVQRRWKVSYQYGLDGIRRELNISRTVLSIIVIFITCIVALAFLYIVKLQDINQAQDNLVKVQKENILLRQKLDYYTAIIDTIYQKLDTLKLFEDKSGLSDKQYPYYKDNKEEFDLDNTFIYDTYLDGLVNSSEQQIRQITSTIRLDYFATGSAYAASTDIQAKLGDGPSIYPTFGRWSDGWGTRVHPFYHRLYFHYGVDIANKTGTPIYATGDGQVSLTGYDPEYGKLIKIKHSNGYETRYGHLHNFQVAKGDFVHKGQIIALMGNTGMSTGPHLHYEVLVDGKKVNPLHYLNRIDDTIYYAKQ